MSETRFQPPSETESAAGRKLDVARVKRSKERWRTFGLIVTAIALLFGGSGATAVSDLLHRTHSAQEAASAASANAQIQSRSAATQSARADAASSSAASESARADAAVSALRAANLEKAAQPSATPEPTDGIVWRPPTILAFNSSSHNADLDSPPTDNQFGRYPTVGGGTADLGRWFGTNGGLEVLGGSQEVFLGQETGTYSVCNSDNNYSSDDLAASQLVAQSWFCLRTSDGRIAVFQVVSASSDTLDTVVTVYNGPNP